MTLANIFLVILLINSAISADICSNPNVSAKKLIRQKIRSLLPEVGSAHVSQKETKNSF